MGKQKSSLKARFMRKHASLLKKPSLVDGSTPEVHGLLISINPRRGESKALAQIVQFTKRMSQLLFPDARRLEYMDVDLDVDLSFEQEIQSSSVEATKSCPEQKFASVTNTSCLGVIFLRFNLDICPVAFMLRLIDHVQGLDEKARVKLKEEICLTGKWIPITSTAASNTTDITAGAKKLIASNHARLEGKSVAFLPECRSNSVLSSKKIVDCVAEALSVENELLENKISVNLKDPDYCLVATVFKSVCGFSLLPDYYKHKKYNLLQIASLK